MRSTPSSILKDHNQIQRDYFENHLKSTMIPIVSPYVRRQTEEVLKIASFRPGDRVLEVGCGMGRYTLLLAELGIDVEGLDLSPILLERLRGYNEGGRPIPLHCADIQKAQPQLNGLFDGIIGFFTLHHLQELGEAFLHMSRSLKPGGKVIFLEPNPYNLLYYLQILLTPRMTWKGDKGILKMRRNIIQKSMKEAGLVNVSLHRFGFFPPFLANRPWGAPLEKKLERFFLFKKILPFQIFKGEKPFV